MSTYLRFGLLTAATLIALFTLAVSSVFAQSADRVTELQEEVGEALGVDPAEVVIIADLNVYNAQVESNGDTGEYTVSFTLQNNGDVQPQVKYAVELAEILPDNEGDVVVDKMVASETVSMLAGQSRDVVFTYAPPANLNGTYELRILAANEKGLEFGGTSAGNIVLRGGGGVSIDVESCFLRISGEEEQYALNRGIDVSVDEELRVQCDAVTNNSDAQVIITPRFIVHERTEFGVIVDEVEGSPETLAANETKSLSFVVPVQEKPQSYEAVFSLGASNDVNLRYVTQGTSATIQNVSLDRDQYDRGQSAEVTLFVSGQADVFPGARANDVETTSLEEQSTVLAITITSGSTACAETVNRELSAADYNGPIVVEAKISRDCVNPTVAISLSDSSGQELDTNTFEIESAKEAAVLADNNDEQKSNAGIILAFIIITIVVVIAILVGRRKDVTKVLAFVVVASGMLFAGGQSAHAVTFYIPQSNYDANNDTGRGYYGWYQTSQPSYTQCEEVIAQSRLQWATCANVNAQLNMFIDGTQVASHYEEQDGGSHSTQYYDTGWESLNLGTKSPGTHNISFRFDVDRLYDESHDNRGRDRSVSGHPIITTSNYDPSHNNDWFCGRCSGWGPNGSGDVTKAGDCPCFFDNFDQTYALSVNVTAAQCNPLEGPYCDQDTLINDPRDIPGSACEVGAITTPPGISGTGNPSDPWRWTCSLNGQTSQECVSYREVIPECGLTATGDDILIDFASGQVRQPPLLGQLLLSGDDRQEYWEISRNASIPAGTYEVHLHSFDGYFGRESAVQNYEQYNLVFRNGGADIATSSPTQDVADGVVAAEWSGQVDAELVVASDATEVVARHAHIGGVQASWNNSIEPVCAVLRPVQSPQCPDLNNDNICDPCTDTNNDGECDHCVDADADGTCDPCVDADNDGTCECLPGDDATSCQPCTDANNNGICDPDCRDLNNDGQCDTQICGNGIVETGESCDDGGVPGGCDDTCQLCEGESEFLCNNICTSIVLEGANQVNLLRDGGAEDATLTVTTDNPSCDLTPQNCVLSDGTAVTFGQPTTVPITNHPTTLSATCSDPQGDPDDEIDTDDKTIQCVCTARRCTASGTCAATPVFASSYTASACSSECSTNADCGSGNIQEVQP